MFEKHNADYDCKEFAGGDDKGDNVLLEVADHPIHYDLSQSP
jgi:hypothetical protein